jgi:alkylated DNA nucleotide flippase Atl1
VRAQEISFLKLVQGDKQFQVPLCQRTGSVVLAPGRLQAGGVQRWLVVDGQQRLTTLMLAFTALRDHLASTGDVRAADRVHRQLLVNEFHEGPDHYRLLPTQADRDAYAACVGATPQAGGGDTIGAAYRFFRGALDEGRGSGDDSWATAVETVLKDLLSIVEITAEAGDNVYRIFESINNTGVGLSQSDLLRNYVFMLLPTRGERVCQELWLPMQQRLGPRHLDLLVWLDLVVRGHHKVSKSDIYREQQKRLEPLAGDEEALQREIAGLAVRASQLTRVLEPRRESSPALREALHRLDAWGGRVHYPLALHLLALVDEGATGADEAARALEYAESYLVRRMICQVPTNNLNRVFMDAPKELEQDRSPAEAVRRFLSGRRRNWPTDDEPREAIRRNPFYWGGQPGHRQHVLRRLEESYGASEPVDFRKARLTVEHVLPRRPPQAWYDLLAEDAGEGQTPQELHDALVHTLGNLTLTGENSKLSHHPFRRKQEILDGSALRMNQEIASAARWGKAEILDRADRLAERAVRLWPAPIGAARSAGEEWHGWVHLRAALVAMPSGTWTTYGDIAGLVGSHAVSVGNHLAGRPGVSAAYRVLTSDGRVSPGFRWPDGRTESPRELLESQGVPFDAAGRAHRSHRLVAAELATLIGRDVPHEEARDVPPDAETAAAAGRFEAQLKENQPEAADGVLAALDFWERQGGHRAYGRHDETSCFPALDAGVTGKPHVLWPLALYPVAGTAEVVFQHLRSRSPFDDVEQRRELMRRLNTIDGIALAEAKLELRPSFPLAVFAERGEEICAVLEWFVHAAAQDLAGRP